MALKIFIGLLATQILFLTGTIPTVFFQKDTITFYDIGQGDAIHIRTKSGFDMLIDGGPGTQTLSQKLTQDMPWYDSTVDVVMATHFDADHITGFAQVLDTYKVQCVILNQQVPETELAKNLIKKIESKHIPIKHMKEGERLKLSDGIMMTFSNTQVDEKAMSNDHSIVVRLVSPQKTFLLTGDLEQSQEQKLIDARIFLKVQVLKAGHHGSKTSSSAHFLDATDPEEAVLSFGLNNKYGHPNKETVDALTKRGVRLRKTVPEGDIVYVL